MRTLQTATQTDYSNFGPARQLPVPGVYP